MSVSADFDRPIAPYLFKGSTGVGRPKAPAGRFVEGDTVVDEPDGETASSIKRDRV